MIETNQTGVYITQRGIPIEKKPMLITANEWLFLWELSAVKDMPIGSLIVNLALAEHNRLKIK